MKYVDRTFTLPVCAAKLSDLEYSLRVGVITQEEFDAEQVKFHQSEAKTINCS